MWFSKSVNEVWVRRGGWAMRFSADNREKDRRKMKYRCGEMWKWRQFSKGVDGWGNGGMRWRWRKGYVIC